MPETFTAKHRKILRLLAFALKPEAAEAVRAVTAEVDRLEAELHLASIGRASNRAALVEIDRLRAERDALLAVARDFVRHYEDCRGGRGVIGSTVTPWILRFEAADPASASVPAGDAVASGADGGGGAEGREGDVR
jgi:hypothetical protein